MTEERMIWHMGFAYGLLHGISKRPDVPNELRETCKILVDRYRKEWDDEHKPELN
jgi:hypothetical protein